MNSTKKKNTKVTAKKSWKKPKLLSGKEIGFLGLGSIQADPYNDPS
jgi:hypothetical protein